MNVQIIHPYFTNLPTDVIVNNLHMLADSPQDADTVADIVAPLIQAMINGIYGVSSPAKAAYIDWAQSYIKVFDLSDPTPRVPAVRPIPTAAGTLAVTIPTEVAVVTTFQAAPESGVPFQRLYNRIFLGGITQNHILAGAADQYPRISNGLVTAVNTAMENLAVALPFGTSPAWVQVSNAGGVTAAREIVGGWTDNSPDTQRRRSVNATLRNPWTI